MPVPAPAPVEVCAQRPPQDASWCLCVCACVKVGRRERKCVPVLVCNATEGFGPMLSSLPVTQIEVACYLSDRFSIATPWGRRSGFK